MRRSSRPAGSRDAGWSLCRFSPGATAPAAPPDGARWALAWLFDAADAADLGWEIDLGWVVRAGQDAQTWIAREAARLVAVHAKDLAPEGQAVDEDGWTILGEGLLPWPKLAAALRPHTDLIVFEHDNPKDAEACLRGSLGFMQRAFS